MILIVLCHIIRFYPSVPGHASLSQVFNVGVYTFFAISGYLYGQKTIADFRLWFVRRFQTVLLPYFVVIGVVIPVTTFLGKGPGIYSTVMYLLNLQGLPFLTTVGNGPFVEVEVLGPLWFVTVIMFCYCMVPILQRIRERMRGGAVTLNAYCLSGILFGVVSFGLSLAAHIVIAYFAVFILGYFAGGQGS